MFGITIRPLFLTHAMTETNMTRITTILTASLISMAAVAAETQAPEVGYPDGYRDWHHVKSMMINPGHPLFDTFGGLHHLYANKKAQQGYAQGRFPNGAVIVFDLLGVKVADNTVQEADRKLVGVMLKDAKKYASTGGWGFEGFKGDTRERLVTQASAVGCFGCHTGQEKSDFVFIKARR
jgi:hypothetical protein